MVQSMLHVQSVHNSGSVGKFMSFHLSCLFSSVDSCASGIVFHVPQDIFIFSSQVAPHFQLPHHVTFPDQSLTFFFLCVVRALAATLSHSLPLDTLYLGV